jgi:putative NADH-flavin reductase
MRIAVLAASGGTGHQLAAQALDRGHSVLALARDPRKVNLPGSADLTVVTADVLEADMAGLLTDVEAVVSGIGIRQGDPAGTLLAGARALAAAAPARLVWLGALGVGASASKAGPLADGPVSPTRRTVALAEFKSPALMPARVTRATVAAAMLDEAEKSQHSGEIVIPLP